MSQSSVSALPLWSLALPVVGCALLFVAFGGVRGPMWTVLFTAMLVGSVLAAVHHAEVVAHRTGEPFGTLILAVAVTVIEVALIVSMMLSGSPDAPLIARDTVFAAIMIVCNGVVGLCILLGGIRHRELTFRVEGTNPTLTVLAALSTLTLVLPTFTTSSPGPTFTPAQLMFAGFSSLVLYGTFVFIQTVRHRDYFLPTVADDINAHAPPPSAKATLVSGFLLLVSLVAVIGLAKALSPAIEQGIRAMGAPKALVGVAIALLVLMPESLSAVRAALANRLQTSLNLALGSALASIGLSIPAVAMVSIWFHLPLSLGLGTTGITLLALTLIVGVLSLATGRTTVLQGVVHIVIFAAYLFLTLVP